MSLLQKELEEMLGTKEEFEKKRKENCEECSYKEECEKEKLVDIADKDLDEKLNQEYQDEMRDSLKD